MNNIHDTNHDTNFSRFMASQPTPPLASLNKALF